MPNIRIVPDTGFYVAAALKDGYARRYLVGQGSVYLSYQLFTSPEILLETQAKLEDKFCFDRQQVVEMLNLIRQVATTVHPTQKLRVVRDPDDNIILECALQARAEVILSFDKDLLKLKEYEKIKIVHPSMLKYWF